MFMCGVLVNLRDMIFGFLIGWIIATSGTLHYAQWGISDDSPLFRCETMGNRQCGPVIS